MCKVSILVLMDLSFLHKNMKLFNITLDRFNPCSYGSFVLTCAWFTIFLITKTSFNPCSYGSFVLTLLKNMR